MSPFESTVHEGGEGTHLKVGPFAKALGSRNAIVMQNFGLSTSYDTVEEIVSCYLSLDRYYQVVLLAETAVSSKEPKEIEDAEAAEYVSYPSFYRSLG